MTTRPNWDAIRDLSRRVLREGVPLILTDDVRALLLHTATEVAIPDANAALQSEAGALALLRECARRITDGSNRLMDALHEMWGHQKRGDWESARQQMRDVLSVEVVPYYRESAQGQLDDMADEP
ncbi:DUSAM domain-containing protein [Corallococcus sp. bb12-1]|uniref:DUSAM domain-containing protein n=1 Tax=Corallococcus sp. bb12-1 TaxID=2996784 RepID=UPI00226F2EC7|nr:DUSAM domain-containing protein [Corallococcus sp. bb12-1]MCY1043538.1 DUSAM domain-containing protein [Corallococcus sp. bb12-1]